MAKIGQMLDGPGPKDAIHIAIVPVCLGEDMEPGQHIRVVGGKAYRADGCAIGMVDPFLESMYLPEDSWVNMFLFPETITDLRHEWSLASYDDNKELVPLPRLDAESVEWIENFAHMHNTSYEGVIVRCQEALSFQRTYQGHDGRQISWVTFYGRDIHSTPEGFWEHYERATGWLTLPEQTERVTFTCSC